MATKEELSKQLAEEKERACQEVKEAVAKLLEDHQVAIVPTVTLVGTSMQWGIQFVPKE